MPRRLGALANRPVSELKGVGQTKATTLGKVNIHSVLDLLTTYPRRYVDRTNEARIDDTVIGEECLVIATVESSSVRRMRNGKPLAEIKVSDETGTLSINFFNQPWRSKQLSAGRTAAFFGKVDAYRGKRQMVNPVVDVLSDEKDHGDKTGKIVPLYPQSQKEGLMSWELAAYIREALDRAGEFIDPMPEWLRDEFDLNDRTWAVNQIHDPESMAAARQARHRLAFDELFRLQSILIMRKRKTERDLVGIAHQTEGDLVNKFREHLPYELTGAQEKAVAEIADDMARPHPMHRLLQGDVGSGKTLVAVYSMLLSVQGGYQAAIMAPTEVLAEQHYESIRGLVEQLTVSDDGTLLGDRPLRTVLLTGSTSAAERKQLLADLAAGNIDLVVGTHALLTEGVDFRQLGAVVIDEQHRFGVEQRAALRDKGESPDVLVMTATPIPRTAAMTVYGDLDVTVLDEMPPGRVPIKTLWARGMEEESAWQTLREEVASGRQGFVVCPLVEESEKLQAKSAVLEYQRLQEGELNGLRVGLLHGQLASKEKDAVMEAFRRQEYDVLVATTVIEVGVDVPNATVMIIEDADRFGIAQLHQLRGRVGRGQYPGTCFLLGEGKTNEGATRLEALEQTTDGFILAEVDLDLRGEGTILGASQSGRTDLKLASLARDKDLVVAAREAAMRIIDADPWLTENDDLADEIRELLDPEEIEYLFKS